jgi:class 3 adenylate cyclase
VTHQGVGPQPFEKAAVVFADLKDFTPYSQHHSPRQVVDALSELFAEWDAIAVKHDVQKIKTIGDAFMGVAGVLTPADNPVRNCVACGLAFLNADAVRRIGLDIRVGISVGKVVSGLLGRGQFLYDLWGEAVNTAARMESHGKPGHVNLSELTYREVQSEFPGWIPWTKNVKGIASEMPIYRLARR